MLLTLALAMIAFRSLSKTQASLELTRQQIELNKQQSKGASEASERHSQATISAVNKQIAVRTPGSRSIIQSTKTCSCSCWGLREYCRNIRRNTACEMGLSKSSDRWTAEYRRRASSQYLWYPFWPTVYHDTAHIAHRTICRLELSCSFSWSRGR